LDGSEKLPGLKGQTWRIPKAGHKPRNITVPDAEREKRRKKLLFILSPYSTAEDLDGMIGKGKTRTGGDQLRKVEVPTSKCSNGKKKDLLEN